MQKKIDSLKLNCVLMALHDCDMLNMLNVLLFFGEAGFTREWLGIVDQ